MKKWVISLVVLDVIIAICFFLTYGPISYFRDFLITTAMTTMSHKYLARIFYTDEMISEVMNKNYITSFSEGTDASKIDVGNFATTYENEYEEAILKRNKKDLYKIIETTYNGYKVYITAIYDPTRVELVQTSYLGSAGETLLEMSKKNGALVSINAGGFVDPGGYGNGGTPMGSVLKDGKVAWLDGDGSGNYVGITDEGVLVLQYYKSTQAALNAGIRDAVQFGPYLIVNGVSADVGGNGGWGINPRTVIAQRKDGIILFVVVDGNGTKYNWNGRGGVSMDELIDILERYGAYNAANMDGGASTTMVVKNQLHNNPCGYGATGERALPNGWMVK